MNSCTEMFNKKVYRTPSLTRYGSLTEMTAANSSKQSTKDAGRDPLKRPVKLEIGSFFAPANVAPPRDLPTQLVRSVCHQSSFTEL